MNFGAEYAPCNEKMIKFCIFDLDGTIFNTLTTITYYVNSTFEKHGFPPISEEQCSSFIGHGARTLIRRTLEAHGIVNDELAVTLHREYNAAYNKNTLYLTEPYEGIPELLFALKEHGVRLGVLSNKPDETTNIIIRSFFENLFDDVRGGRDGVALKPAPDALNMMIADFGCSPDEVMYIGDTGVDITTGLRAGVGATVGVSWGFRTRLELLESGADIIADHPSEILREVLCRD